MKVRLKTVSDGLLMISGLISYCCSIKSFYAVFSDGLISFGFEKRIIGNGKPYSCVFGLCAVG